MFFKKVVLKNFAKLTRTWLRWSSFCNNVNQCRCFPRNFAKPFGSPFLENIYGWLHLLAASSFNTKFESSHGSFSSRKDVIKNFINFTGKHLYWSLFFKNKLWHRSLPVGKNSIKQIFLQNTSGELLLKICH